MSEYEEIILVLKILNAERERFKDSFHLMERKKMIRSAILELREIQEQLKPKEPEIDKSKVIIREPEMRKYNP